MFFITYIRFSLKNFIIFRYSNITFSTKTKSDVVRHCITLIL